MTACALVSGCAVGPNYQEPKPTVDAHFTNASQPGINEGQVVAAFWTLFGDATLDQLVQDALAANKDLARAEANLRASRAAARLSGFDAYPTVTAGASYSHALESQHELFEEPNLTRAEREIDTYDVGFDATWELDFFGRVRRSIQASRADMHAAEAALRDTEVSVAAEVARNYFVLRGLQDRLDVAERNAVNQRQTLELTQVRLDAGRGSELDVSRAAAQLETTLATVPPLRTLIATTIYRISVLTGRTPTALEPELAVARPMPALPTLNAIGSPEALLRRRPDVRVAEQGLAAATARIGVAVADLFPRVTFIGSIGYNAGTWNALGSSASQTFLVGPSITWAAFDLGRVRARIGIAHAQADLALADYQAAVLNALEDTEDSLVNFGQSQLRETTLERAATQSTKAARLARERFEGGLSDFLNVLQAERDDLAAQDSLADGRTQTATALVAVYKALGGGWMPSDTGSNPPPVGRASK
jgi:multidrug efflux system outer membrane protein